MSVRPLNDDEVLSEMRKMVSFIKQEAVEKAREIQVRADEEFAIEKGKLVRGESVSLDAIYEKKAKAALTSTRIAQSTATNAARLKLLQTREEHLQTLFDSARSKLATTTSNPEAYATLLQQLSLQGLLQLTEPKVTLVTRPQDVSVLEGLISTIQSKYKEIYGKPVSLTATEGLLRDSSGGVKLVSHDEKITIDNTLEERLRLIEEQMLPIIRTDLFGPNPNRHFFN